MDRTAEAGKTKSGGVCFMINKKFVNLHLHLEHLSQGSSNISLEVQSAAEFSSNPDQTHLPVIF